MARGKRAGNKGQGSKWITKVRRRRIYARDGHRCVYCGRLAEKLTLDHVIPRSKGGTNVSENLITACMDCNRDRGDMPIGEFIVDVPGAALVILTAMTSPLPQVAP
jgi:5-methylcytosine-specific restriction endonuclease McrA